MNNSYEAAGGIAQELTAQQVEADAATTAGGLFTIPRTSTVGWICTISWECTSPHRSCGLN